MPDARTTLNNIMNNPQMMQNATVKNVMELRNKNDVQGLLEIYKNTCKTFGKTPDKRFFK